MLILQTTENELIGAAGVAKFFGGGKKNCMVNADAFPIDFDAKKRTILLHARFFANILRAARSHFCSRLPSSPVISGACDISDRPHVVDVIAGDLNINLGEHGPLSEIFQRQNFVVAVNLLNTNNAPVATSPYHDSSDAITEEDIYDHIIVRNAIPVNALVRHFGAEAIADNDRRAEAFMKAAGSDHYPLEGIIEIDTQR